MSANFIDFAEYIEQSNKALASQNNAQIYSDEYWEFHKEKVMWDRKILMLMPDRNLLPGQIKVLRKQGCQAFNIWFPTATELKKFR